MKVVAHRGFAAEYPEHTEIAFRKALELPIAGIETDIRLAKTGEVVCVHDPIVNRVSNGSGRVSALSLTELRSYNFGTEEEPASILTLNELLDIFEEYPDKDIFIESKHPNRYAGMLEEELVKILRYRGMEEDPHVHHLSFSIPVVRRMARLAPKIDRIHLRRPFEHWVNPIDIRAKVATGLGISLRIAKIKPELIGKRGLPTYIFTVDEPEDMIWARDHGLDMMATNCPDKAVEVLGHNVG